MIVLSIETFGHSSLSAWRLYRLDTWMQCSRVYAVQDSTGNARDERSAVCFHALRWGHRYGTLYLLQYACGNLSTFNLLVP
eukprot:scaffold46443_cov52-Prasinocladus_malaysianus.AAC.1